MKGWKPYLLPGIAALLLLLYYAVLRLGPTTAEAPSTDASETRPLPGANAPPRRPSGEPSRAPTDE